MPIAMLTLIHAGFVVRLAEPEEFKMLDALASFAAASPVPAFGLAFLVLLAICALAVRPARRGY